MKGLEIAVLEQKTRRRRVRRFAELVGQIPYVGDSRSLDGTNEQIATPIWPGRAAWHVGVGLVIMQEVRVVRFVDAPMKSELKHDFTWHWLGHVI